MWPLSTMIRRREKRAAAHYDFLTFGDIEGRTSNTRSGVTIDQTTAMSLPTVFRCVQINCDMVASLPIDSFAKRADNDRESYSRPFWLEAPNDEQDWGEFIHQVQYSYELDGNAFIIKASERNTGRLVALYVLNPQSVCPKRLVKGGPLVFEVAQDGSASVILAANEVIHIHGMTPPGTLRGLSPIGQLREALGVRAAAEEFGGNFFGNAAVLSGVIESDTKLTPEQATRLKADFSKRHGGLDKSHAIGVLEGGAHWKPISINPDEAQFIETMKFGDVQIACMFGVPPEWVSDVEGAKGYVTSLYAKKEMYLLTGLDPRLCRIERPFSRLLPRPAYVRFNRNALLRMDPEQRIAYYNAGQVGEWLLRDEIRSLEELPPLPDGEGKKPLHSVQWQENAPPDDSATDEGNEPASSGLFDGQNAALLAIAQRLAEPQPIHVQTPVTIQRGAVQVDSRMERGAVQVSHAGMERGAVNVNATPPPLRLVREKRFIYDPDNPDRITGVREIETDDSEGASVG